MPEQLSRYHNKKIIEHLAQQYVLGLLTSLVCTRIDKLLKTNRELVLRINYWQNHFNRFDKQIPELAPKIETWQNIQNFCEQLPTPSNTHEKHSRIRFGFNTYNTASVLSMITFVLLGYFVFLHHESNQKLNYLAVLTDNNQQPQLIVRHYGESQKLIINLINMPIMTSKQNFEIWVVANADGDGDGDGESQAHSLGVIPQKTRLISKNLTDEQWYLITHASLFFITIKGVGGTSNSVPNGSILSKGVPITLIK